MRRTFRDVSTALSLANICFISAWLVLINPGHYSYYNWEFDPGFSELTGLVLDVLLLAGLLWTLVSLARRIRHGFVRVVIHFAFLAMLVIPINAALIGHGNEAVASMILGHGWFTILFLLLGGIGLALIIRWRDQVVKLAIFVLLVLSPVLLANVFSTARLHLKLGPSQELFSNQTAVRADKPQGGSHHVVWMIFDEMDQRMTFAERPSGMELPEFDRLRQQAVYAENSYPPAGFTLASLPALISGKLVSNVEPTAPNELTLTLDDNKREDWSKIPSVFAEARGLGFSTAVAGWYHPYCRIFGNDLDKCDWVSATGQSNPVQGHMTVVKSMRLWARDAFFTIPFAFRLFQESYDSGRSEDHIEEYKRVLESATKVCADPELNLIMLHFPVPHHPWMYDRRSGTFSVKRTADYLDNLALADRTLGEMRRALEAKGMWDSSTILVTSDHWWRIAPLRNGRRDHRVPFLFKLPGENEALTYEQPFNSVLIHDLLLDVLTNKITTPNDASHWLDLHRTLSESPYTRDLP